MDETYEQGHQLRALAMRVAALEDNVAFLEQWCEEQQDLLDRTAGPVGYDYEVEPGSKPAPRASLRVVDLREVALSSADADDDDSSAEMIVALVETEHERMVRQIRLQLNRLRTRLAATLAPPAEVPPPRRPPAEPRKVSAKPAGRTAP